MLVFRWIKRDIQPSLSRLLNPQSSNLALLSSAWRWWAACVASTSRISVALWRPIRAEGTIHIVIQTENREIENQFLFRYLQMLSMYMSINLNHLYFHDIKGYWCRILTNIFDHTPESVMYFSRRYPFLWPAKFKLGGASWLLLFAWDGRLVPPTSRIHCCIFIVSNTGGLDH